jgi:hypothetical protein
MDGKSGGSMRDELSEMPDAEVGVDTTTPERCSMG